jgi:DNA helicase HerA-like ATPase
MVVVVHGGPLFMYLESGRKEGEATNQERRDLSQPEARVLGRVVQCNGSRATISAFANGDDGSVTGHWSVGRLVSVNLGEVRIVGLVHDIQTPDNSWSDEEQNQIRVYVELIGEVRDNPLTREPVFDRGVTGYPHIGAIAHRIRSADLEAVYRIPGRRSIRIGQLSQDERIAAHVSIDETLNRHFAVVGSTGVGKSSAVSLLLHKAIDARPDLRVVIFDPHNEFASAFPDHSVTLDAATMELPFWLFRLEEFAEVLFRGRDGAAEEIDILRDLIPVAKLNYRYPSASGKLRRITDASGMTADTPVPYRMSDLIRLIDERMGQLDSKDDRPTCRALRNRIEAALGDPRYRFMFGSRIIEDTIHEAIGTIFRVPHDGRPITCFQMAGLPSEVVNSVCSVLARLAFDLALWSNGKLRLLLVCEEAHRYMPSDHRLGFAPTRHALARIAKEGRKYGCYLGVVTQRPGELDPTILSQCSTVFAMRLANERDQEIIRSAIADSSESTLAFLSSMGQREAIAFGDGVATPMRLKFERLGPDMIPGRGAGLVLEENAGCKDDIDLAAIIERLRDVPKPRRAPVATIEPGDGFAQPREHGRGTDLFSDRGEYDRRSSARPGGIVFRPFQE